MKLFVGTSGYAYPAWKGSFYPAGLAAKKMLPYYAAQFSSVELNHTFYKMPTEAQLAAAVALVPETFRFSIKVPMAISHRREPRPELLAIFAQRLASVGRQAGQLYWQLPPTLQLDLPRLRDTLQQLPSWPQHVRGGHALALAIELPHPSWHVAPVRRLLEEYSVGLVRIDALSKDGEPVPAPTWDTSRIGYVRLRRPDYDEEALRAWVRRLRRSPLDELYVYFKHEDTGLGPRFAKQFLRLWNA